MKKVAVIGAGLGGLSAAARLAAAGYKVTVFEKNNIAGGKAGFFESNNFRFDTGPSLLTMPFTIEQLFQESGENINDYLRFNKLDVLCKYFYSDGTVLNAYSEPDNLAKEFEQVLSIAPARLKKYLDYSKKIYELTADLFLFNDFSSRKNIFNKKALNTLIHLNKIDAFRNMHEANSSYFSESKAVQLFDRYATYNGSNPFEAPATLNIIQHVEYNMGGFIPIGGIRKIPEALRKLCEKKGVEFKFGTEVNKIILKNNVVSGLEFSDGAGEGFESFDIIISNADVNYTYKNLLNGSSVKHARRYQKLEPSSSALTFYWGIKGIHSQLEIHNILFSDDYKREFDQLFNQKIVPEEPTIYIYISSKYNGEDAPEDCENWFVMINAPYNSNQNWELESERIKKFIIERIHKVLGIDLNEMIITEKIMTPDTIEKNTSSYKGSLYGISSNSRNAAFLRQKNKSKDYKGLYFCGGSAHPGGGIPLVILSGKITSDLIQQAECNT